MSGYKVTDCEKCEYLSNCRTQIVNGSGDKESDVLIVGEAPGKEEDQTGVPFVGRSGEILIDSLNEAGFSREDVRITNCVRCRPPNNRDPHVDELKNCRKYLIEEIISVDPKIVVALGRIPTKQLTLKEVEKVTNSIGNTVPHSIQKAEFTLVLSVHPAATLYNSNLRPEFKSVFEKVSQLL